MDEFIKLTYQIWEGKHRCVIPRDILRCIMYKFPQFRGYGQQDAHEFLTCLLQFLHDQYKYKIAIESDSDKEEEEEEEEEEKEKKKKKKNRKYQETSIIYDLFSGEIISQVECSECGTKSKKIESITNIQVEIPKQEQVDRAVKERNAKPLPTKGWMQSVFTFVGLQQQSIPLSLCLHSYCTSEDLQNTEKYFCDKCKKKQDAKKTLLISRLPEILTIQIKRFSHDSFWRGSAKISTHVSFPIDNLDLKEYIHPKHINDKQNRDTIYDLSSIVKHMGSTGGGHYICFAKHQSSGKWYKFDDSRVEQISPEKLYEQQAYILFYTRRKQDRSSINSIANLLKTSVQLQQLQTNNKNNNNNNNNNNVLLSRYWLHKVQAFSRPGPIDNLWLSCNHGYPLKNNHKRRKDCSIKIPSNTWLQLTKKYGIQYNTKMLICHDDDEDKDDDNDNDNDNEEEEEDEDIVMIDNNNNNNNDQFDPSLMKKAIHLTIKHYHCPWELSEKSNICIDCKYEQLHKRREYEKGEIRRLEDDGSPQDCALNMKWANQWRNFVHNKTDDIPSFIDNRHIHSKNNKLKDELIKDTDYLMIPSNIWTFLIELYGGGPKIVPIPTKRNIKNIKTKQQHQHQNQHQNQHQHQQQQSSKQKSKSQSPQKSQQSQTSQSQTSSNGAHRKQQQQHKT